MKIRLRNREQVYWLCEEAAMGGTHVCRLPARWLAFPLLLAAGVGPLAAQPPSIADVDSEIARQRQIIDRFIGVLERNPRRGTALDKVYGFHVENGSVDAFVRQLRERTTAHP